MSVKIVVLDALPLDADGDMDWTPLREIGELVLYPHTKPEETIERIADADVVFTNKVRLNAEHFAGAPNLRLVSVLATGYDIIAVAAAREHGVTVCNVPGYSTPSTAQTAIALLLELCNHVGQHAEAVRKGAWVQAGVWSWWETAPVELDGKNLLVLGQGAIGSRVARIGEALGMRILSAALPGRPKPGVSPLDEVLPQADVVSLHMPLTPELRGLFNAERLAQMKPGALLVNTARGPLVDDAAVAAALQSGHLGGYAADVLTVEPPPADQPLLSAPRCLITAHYAWASRESRSRLLAESVGNLKAHLSGYPRNVVS